MLLRGQEWPVVYNSSGARGFFGEGYWYHKYWVPFGLTYNGAGFVTKTTTLLGRPGNMPLDQAHRPLERVPKCIVVKPAEGVVLNAVGLSGPGADILIHEWTERQLTPKWPYMMMLSFMSISSVREDRIEEARLFFSKLARLIRAKGTMFTGIQINFSCPNVGLHPMSLVEEIGQTLDLTFHLGAVPTLVKLNALVRPSDAAVISNHPRCDGLIVSNTIPWGQLPNKIPWKKLFGTDKSPLEAMGGGGLSGAPLMPIVRDWVLEARKCGLKKPIIAGGGILSKEDAGEMLDAGADAIELGSVSILRPWRVQGIINYVNKRKNYKP